MKKKWLWTIIKKEFKNPRVYLLAAVIILSLVGIFTTSSGSSSSFIWIKNNFSAIQSFTQGNLPLSLTVFFMVYVVCTALSLPIASALTLLSGALFGLLAGTILSTLAATVGSQISFLISRRFLGKWVNRRYGERLSQLNQRVENDELYYLFALRLNPSIPFFLINILMGVTSVSASHFFWVSLVGMLPGSAIFVNAGVQLASLENLHDILSLRIFLALIAVGLLPLIMRKLIKN